MSGFFDRNVCPEFFGKEIILKFSIYMNPGLHEQSTGERLYKTDSEEFVRKRLQFVGNIVK